MNFKQLSIATLLAVSGIAANATVTTSLGGDLNASDFITLSSANVSSSTGSQAVFSASIAGTAQAPGGTVGNFLAATANPSSNVTLTLAGTNYVSFEWGSVDQYNTVTVFDASGSQTFNYASYTPNLTTATDYYVNFTGSDITKLVFTSPTANAFEAANFSVTAVPEPTNVAFLLAGLGMVGVMARRRRA